ncbi:MAG: putative Fe-S cluster assembly protein SufT [Gammaproteobacteria bacterium RIFCSPLOWO2_02_FULL_61_13]|nr:MAG: putative Fe-S cluster assembly protein SufT [Gammaproteobacteria bacterium RIFCSPLOWO2_02_FULL_61_13]
MHDNELVTLARDCDAILIPAGTHITVPAGSVVFITQALGGNYTVNVNGNLAQVGARDADALGFDVSTPAFARAIGDSLGPVQEDLLWDQMRTCYDPEIPINIVDLGLVYECKVTPLADAGNRVDVRMTLTAPGCGMGQFLAEDVRSKLMQVPNVSEVNVDLTFDPPWSQDMMTEAARLETGML